MFRLKALASGSAGNAYLARSERAMFLIEAGLAPARLMQALAVERIDPRLLRAAFVSHEHRDHVQAAEMLAKEYGVPIVADERVLLAAGLSDIPGVRPLAPGESMAVGDVEVATFAVPHDSVCQVGFVLRHRDVQVCIATDLGDECPALAESIAGAALVVLEANHDARMLREGSYPYRLRERIGSATGHLSNGQAAGILMRNLRREDGDVWLAHLSQNNNTPRLAHTAVARLLRGAGLEAVRIAVLPRSRPSPEWTSAPRPRQLSLF